MSAAGGKTQQRQAPWMSGLWCSCAGPHVSRTDCLAGNNQPGSTTPAKQPLAAHLAQPLEQHVAGAQQRELGAALKGGRLEVAGRGHRQGITRDEVGFEVCRPRWWQGSLSLYPKRRRLCRDNP